MKEGHIFTDSQIERGYVNYLKDQVSRIGAFDKLVHHITSPGGDVYEGYEAYHFLRGLGKPIKTIVEGQCQSIATFIALAGDEIVMLNPSRWMIHEASIPPMGIGGTADALEKGMTELRKINSEMAERYAFKTKQPLDLIVQQMKKETSMTAHEAKQFGFADEVLDSLGEMTPNTKQYNNLKAVALGKDMEEPNKIIQMIQNLEGKIEAFFKKAIVATGPVAIDLAGADGKMYNVQSENGDLVGKPVTVDGQPANGEIALADGRTLMCENGMVKEIKEAMSAEQKEIQQLKAQLQAMQAEKEAALTAKTASETQVQTVTNAMQEIQKEVVALRKMTVGDPNPVGRGALQTPIVTSDPQKEMYKQLQKEILEKAGLLN